MTTLRVMHSNYQKKDSRDIIIVVPIAAGIDLSVQNILLMEGLGLAHCIKRIYTMTDVVAAGLTEVSFALGKQNAPVEEAVDPKIVTASITPAAVPVPTVANTAEEAVLGVNFCKPLVELITTPEDVKGQSSVDLYLTGDAALTNAVTLTVCIEITENVITLEV